MNRPTKLAERFNLLYDNKWTDALETLQGENVIDEQKIIKKLMYILFVSIFIFTHWLFVTSTLIHIKDIYVN